MAFQIIDDVLDVTESSEVLGKTNNSDIKNNKQTYVNLIGIKPAKDRARNLIESAVKDLDMNNLEETNSLIDIAYYLIERRN